jgi:glyoxylase-like metal-dependent hydrolase (beta-lactamase superfamily II)
MFPLEELVFLEVFPTGPIQANCTLLGDEDSGALVVIDPGEEAELIHSRIEESKLEPLMIIHTHGHIDHAGGTADLWRRLGERLPVALHRDELEIYQNLPMQAQMFGLEADMPPQPSMWLEHGQRIEVGKLSLEVRHTPGHSPGSISLVVHGAPDPLVIVGDLLFAGSIGRTDLWGGSFDVISTSIREQIYTLPEQTRVITGHGPETSVAVERRSNPFVQG